MIDSKKNYLLFVKCYNFLHFFIQNMKNIQKNGIGDDDDIFILVEKLTGQYEYE